MSKIKSREETLALITQIEKKLNDIKDVDVLLETILKSAIEIVNADAGSIYEYNDKDKKLIIRYSQNNTQQKKLAPGEKLPYTFFTFDANPSTISGYCALAKQSVNIADVYNMEEYIDAEKKIKRPYNFSTETDNKTGYHTQSMLVFPLVMPNGRILGVLQIINALNENDEIIPFTKENETMLISFASKACEVLSYAYLTDTMLRRMTSMAEMRDPKETYPHVQRVSSFAVEIFDRYAVNKGYTKEESEHFRANLATAAKSHDFGKVGIPDVILKKNGLLTREERDIMKGHVCLGAKLFTPPESEIEEMSLEICRYHHERWDGKNDYFEEFTDKEGNLRKRYYGAYCGNMDYMKVNPGDAISSESYTPLKGNEIPLSARIVAVADVFDALTHARSYKDKWDKQRVFDIMKNESGKQFDPELIEAFLQIKDRLVTIAEVIDNLYD